MLELAKSQSTFNEAVFYGQDMPQKMSSLKTQKYMRKRVVISAWRRDWHHIVKISYLIA